MSRLQNIFENLELYCTKHQKYFEIYEEILSKYVDEKVVVVEIGVLSGGSLLMWKKFFGEKARIIGIDLNEKAKELEKYGFEIFIGDQSKPEFWKTFFSKIGPIDILIDDGGHSNSDQIITTAIFRFINRKDMMEFRESLEGQQNLIALNINNVNSTAIF